MLIVRVTTKECPNDIKGHSWTGHGDPQYMWCFKCEQEKLTNKEFIAYDIDKIARTVVSSKRVSKDITIVAGMDFYMVKNNE